MQIPFKEYASYFSHESATLFVEPLFDFDDTKTFLLWFLIKLPSVLEMNLTPKAKVSLRMLKIQHPRGRFESHMKRIQISIP